MASQLCCIQHRPQTAVKPTSRPLAPSMHTPPPSQRLEPRSGGHLYTSWRGGAWYSGVSGLSKSGSSCTSFRPSKGFLLPGLPGTYWKYLRPLRPGTTDLDCSCSRHLGGVNAAESATLAGPHGCAAASHHPVDPQRRSLSPPSGPSAPQPPTTQWTLSGAAARPECTAQPEAWRTSLRRGEPAPGGLRSELWH